MIGAILAKAHASNVVEHVDRGSDWGPALIVAIVVAIATLWLAWRQQHFFITQLVVSRVDRFFDSKFVCEQRQIAAAAWLADTRDARAERHVINALEELEIVRGRLGSFTVLAGMIGDWVVIYWMAYKDSVIEAREERGTPDAWSGVEKLADRLLAKGNVVSAATIQRQLTEDSAITIS